MDMPLVSNKGTFSLSELMAMYSWGATRLFNSRHSIRPSIHTTNPNKPVKKRLLIMRNAPSLAE